jgi:hypothetical protein
MLANLYRIPCLSLVLSLLTMEERPAIFVTRLSRSETMSRRSQPRVTDHALVRFLERAGGMPIESVRRSLEDSLRRAAMAAASVGECDYTVKADGLKYRVRDGHVVTVIPTHGTPAYVKRPHR